MSDQTIGVYNPTPGIIAGQSNDTVDLGGYSGVAVNGSELTAVQLVDGSVAPLSLTPNGELRVNVVPSTGLPALGIDPDGMSRTIRVDHDGYIATEKPAITAHFIEIVLLFILFAMQLARPRRS